MTEALKNNNIIQDWTFWFRAWRLIFDIFSPILDYSENPKQSRLSFFCRKSYCNIIGSPAKDNYLCAGLYSDHVQENNRHQFSTLTDHKNQLFPENKCLSLYCFGFVAFIQKKLATFTCDLFLNQREANSDHHESLLSLLPSSESWMWI
jgi:hypothetical protein